MQSVSSRIWTRVAVSNSYDDNDYTTGTSLSGNGGASHLLNRVESIAWHTWAPPPTKGYAEGIKYFLD